MERKIKKRSFKVIFRKFLCLAVILTIALPLCGSLLPSRAQADFMMGGFDARATHFGITENFDDEIGDIFYCDDLVEETFYVDVDSGYGELLDYYILEEGFLTDNDYVELEDDIMETGYSTADGIIGEGDDYIIEEISPPVFYDEYEYLYYAIVMEDCYEDPGYDPPTRALSNFLTISPATHWTNLTHLGNSQRTVNVMTNAPRVVVTRPSWVNITFGPNSFRLTTTRNFNAAPRAGTVWVTAGSQTRSFGVSQQATPITLNISPTTNWTSLSAAGNTQRTVTVSTNAPTYTVFRPSWVNLAWTSNGFRLTTTRNPNTWSRSGRVQVVAGGRVSDFTITQLAAAPTLTISPATNWTSISAAGGAQRTVVVSTNAPTYNVFRPSWVSLAWTSNGFRLTATRNPNTWSRSGTVQVVAGGLVRSFTVTQLAAAPTLTISPTTNWTNISAAGGAQRTVTVSTNASTYTVLRPPWMSLTWTSNGFRLTAERNPNAWSRSGTVQIATGGLVRSFTVTQLAAAPTLTISPTTNWTNISAAGGAQRTVTVTTNASTFNVTRPAWMNTAWTSNGFRLTASQNTGGARSGTVTVTAGGLSRSFTVSQTANTVRLIFNGNGGTVSPTFQDVVSGSTISNLPTPTRAGRRFIDWFNTSATTGGNRIRNGMNAPNTNTTYWARWTDPNRHCQSWWPAANSGTTNIDFNVFLIVSGNATLNSGVNIGMNAWNNSAARVNFARNFSSTNTVNIRLDGNSRVRVGEIGTRITQFHVQLSPHEFEELAVLYRVTETQAAGYIMAHELGHVLGLKDNPYLGGIASVMRQGEIRIHNIVTSFDVQSVNMIY